jgi:hypothetical protein
MAKANPTAADRVEPDPVEPAAGAKRLKMTSKLPHSGKMIVVAELTGRQELDAAMEAVDPETAAGRLRHTWASAMRSVVSIDGKAFDSSEHTADTFRDLFSSKDFMFVVELYLMANRPTDADAATFRDGAKATV